MRTAALAQAAQELAQRLVVSDTTGQRRFDIDQPTVETVCHQAHKQQRIPECAISGALGMQIASSLCKEIGFCTSKLTRMKRERERHQKIAVMILLTSCP